MIKLGNISVESVYIGSTPALSGFIGDVPLWGSEEPVANKARLVFPDSTVVNIPFTGAGDTVLTSGEISPYKNNLISAVIYDGVTSIGDSAFTSCSSLTSVTIGDGVTSIGRNAFRYCSGLTSITVEATTPPTLANSLALRDTNNCPIYVPCESVDSYKTAWSSYASRIGCKFTKAKLTLTGGTVVEILSTGGTELSQDEISPYINSVVSAVIYDGVTSIGDFAFFECSGLTSVTIPNSVTSIGDWAFRECSSLTSIVIPSGVTSIGMGAFYYDALTSITIPNSVTSLGAGAFYACPLTSANIPSGITSLENTVFAKCSSLTSIVIPSDITLFGYRVFEDCSGLTSVTIPSGVTSIGYSAFTNCYSLTSVTVEATTPPTLDISAFDNTNDCPIYVPCSSLDTYKAATGWSDYADRIQCIPSPEPDPSTEYFHFISLADGSQVKANSKFQYSLDGGNTWTAGDDADKTLSSGASIYFKGMNSQALGGALFKTYSAPNSAFEIRGNIMSLIYGDLFENYNVLPCNGVFESLFRGTYSIKKADKLVLPALPATEDCYKGMFDGCSGMTTAPALPATTLAVDCYALMFGGCTSLTTAPVLSATTLAGGCYQHMFDGCSGLTSAPALPATALTRGCYGDMFNGCSSLTTAPALPATALDGNCYMGMFKGCTSLQTAPDLPATAVTGTCYYEMFADCTSLTSAPALLATTLDVGCYQRMFSGCTSLQTAPDLPAETLVRDCYKEMFSGCSSLNYIKAMFTTTPSNTYTQNWVTGVFPVGMFVKNANATYADSALGLPNAWTVQTADA